MTTEIAADSLFSGPDRGGLENVVLRYDDGVIHPAPLVKPLTLVITPAPNPIDPQIVLVEPPIAHPMVVVAIVRVPETPDAAVLELGALGVLGFSALVLARRRTSHAIGTLAL